MAKETKNRVQSIIQAVRDSALEGFDGSWNAFTEEGKDGFEHMATLLEELASILKIELKEYSSKNDDFEFDEIGVVDERFFLSLEYIGEGLNGDYDEEDEEDVRLLRFTLSEKDENKQLQEVRNGSACTLLEADAPRDQLLHAALKMLHYVNIHSKDDEVNQEAVQNLSHAELVKGKVKLPKIK